MPAIAHPAGSSVHRRTQPLKPARRTPSNRSAGAGGLTGRLGAHGPGSTGSSLDGTASGLTNKLVRRLVCTAPHAAQRAIRRQGGRGEGSARCWPNTNATQSCRGCGSGPRNPHIPPLTETPTHHAPHTNCRPLEREQREQGVRLSLPPSAPLRPAYPPGAETVCGWWPGHCGPRPHTWHMGARPGHREGRCLLPAFTKKCKPPYGKGFTGTPPEIWRR